LYILLAPFWKHAAQKKDLHHKLYNIMRNNKGLLVWNRKLP
jgi:hypothetical protein